MARTGYAIAEFQDPEEERRRLAVQAEVLAQEEERAFVAAGFPDRGLVLDLGCGPGFVARRLGRDRPEVRFVGVDLERPSLRTASEALAPVRSDALALPFAAGTFDFAYARVVLRHLTDARRAVRELARVVRPGGRLAVLDVDDGSLIVDPMPAGFEEVIAARHASIRARGADPHVGRKLRGYAVEARLVDVRVQPICVTTDAISPRGFAHIILGPFADTIEPERLSPARVAEARQALDGWCALPHAFAMTTAVMVSGAVPQRQDMS